MAIIPPAKANDITNITASIAANIAATYTTGVTLSYAATHAADIAAAISCKCSIAILTADVNATSVLHSQHFIAAITAATYTTIFTARLIHPPTLSERNSLRA